METKDIPVRWQAIVAKYSTPDLWRSIWQVVNSVGPFLIMWYLMYLSLNVSYWLTLLLAIPTAGFMVRIFIIFHDCGHGSFFKSQKANDTLGFWLGLLIVTPYYNWRHDHAIHHAGASDLDRRGIGDVLTLTVEEYMVLPWHKKLGYRIMRNPYILFTVGAFIVFAVTHRFWGNHAGERERASVIWTNLALLGIVGGLSLLIGWQAFLLVEVPALFLASAAGVWLFYVQHNFDGTYWQRHDKWEYFKAGMEGSSFYKLPKILQWFTGNIGFHHIHHLSPKIPNYKLEQAFNENKLFQIKPVTILISLKSLTYRLWDEEKRKLVGFNAVRQRRRAEAMKKKLESALAELHNVQIAPNPPKTEF
jgi:omega-6 fatty acid desaturase (delta-12 desaturase)